MSPWSQTSPACQWRRRGRRPRPLLTPAVPSCEAACLELLESGRSKARAIEHDVSVDGHWRGCNRVERGLPARRRIKVREDLLEQLALDARRRCVSSESESARQRLRGLYVVHSNNLHAIGVRLSKKTSFFIWRSLSTFSQSSSLSTGMVHVWDTSMSSMTGTLSLVTPASSIA